MNVVTRATGLLLVASISAQWVGRVTANSRAVLVAVFLASLAVDVFVRHH